MRKSLSSVLMIGVASLVFTACGENKSSQKSALLLSELTDSGSAEEGDLEKEIDELNSQDEELAISADACANKENIAENIKRINENEDIPEDVRKKISEKLAAACEKIAASGKPDGVGGGKPDGVGGGKPDGVGGGKPEGVGNGR